MSKHKAKCILYLKKKKLSPLFNLIYVNNTCIEKAVAYLRKI